MNMACNENRRYKKKQTHTLHSHCIQYGWVDVRTIGENMAGGIESYVKSAHNRVFKCGINILPALLIGASVFLRCGRLEELPRAAKASYTWDASHVPVSKVIFRADSGKIVIVSRITLLEDGTLAAVTRHVTYASDAVISDQEDVWFVSWDGGINWNRQHNAPGGKEAESVSRYGGMDLFPLEFPDGTLLKTGCYSWENFKDTKENRDELHKQGFYIFTPEEGNAQGIISVSYRAWMRRSRDGGATWEEKEIPFPKPIPHLGSYVGPVITHEGTYILPVWGRFDLKKEPMHVSSFVLRTMDGGDTWTTGLVADGTEHALDFNETSIAQVPNGDLVAVMRTTDQVHLWTAISKDDGETWEGLRDSGMRGSTPYIVVTKDGILAALYSRRQTSLGFETTGLWACVSRDNGATWDVGHQVPLVETGDEFFDGYPGAVALPDGSVYVVYGFHGANSFGGTRFHPMNPDFGG